MPAARFQAAQEHRLKLGLVALALALAIAWLVATPSGSRVDRELVTRAAALDRASPPLHALMRTGTVLGEPKGVLLALLVPAAFGPEVARATVRVCFAASAANQLATSILKWVVNRPRPSGHDRRDNSAFPSGHAAGAAGIAWVVADRHRRLTLWFWGIAFWISASRVFLGRHFPSDVLGGALVGILFAALALRFEHWLSARRGGRPAS